MNLNLSSKLWLSTLFSILLVLLCAGLGWTAIDEARALLKYADPGKRQQLQAALEGYGLILGLAAAVAVVIWPLVALVVVRSFTGPLHNAVQAARAIAAFDLSKPVPLAGNDEWRGARAVRHHAQQPARQRRTDPAEYRRLNGVARDLTSSSGISAKSAASQSEAASGMAAAVEQLSVSIDQVGEHAT